METKKQKSKGFYILRASKTVNGEKIYARDYGKRAFRIWVTLDK